MAVLQLAWLVALLDVSRARRYTDKPGRLPSHPYTSVAKQIAGGSAFTSNESEPWWIYWSRLMTSESNLEFYWYTGVGQQGEPGHHLQMVG